MISGDIITEDCVRSVRPGFGVSPKYLSAVIGKRVKENTAANTPVFWIGIDG
jgi:N-acetylneuraminate synthase